MADGVMAYKFMAYVVYCPSSYGQDDVEDEGGCMQHACEHVYAHSCARVCLIARLYKSPYACLSTRSFTPLC